MQAMQPPQGSQGPQRPPSPQRPHDPQAPVLSFRDLVVWQKAMDLVVEIYALTRDLPKTEEYRLIGQMTRAAVSIPANIAEGHARTSRREYAQFISIAKGSHAELETYLQLIVRLGFLPETRLRQTQGLSQEVGRMLTSLRQRLLA